MSRSAADATRFTATSPHAYSKPTSIRSAASSASRSNPPPRRIPNPNARGPPQRPGITSAPNSPPQIETPIKKVARLRAARLAEKNAQISRWDQIVVRGRVWADRAHKVTAYSLIGFSVVAASITAFALTDMILHNRRKRNAFYAEQHSLYDTRLIQAIETEKSGMPLDEDQTLILNRERARVQAEESAKERTWSKRAKGLFLGGLKKDDDEEQTPVVVPTEGQILEMIGVDQRKLLEVSEQGIRDGAGPGEEMGDRRDGNGVLAAIEQHRREGEKILEERGVTGGPLDQVAEEAVEKVKETGKGGWLNWGR